MSNSITTTLSNCYQPKHVFSIFSNCKSIFIHYVIKLLYINIYHNLSQNAYFQYGIIRNNNNTYTLRKNLVVTPTDINKLIMAHVRPETFVIRICFSFILYLDIW